MYPSLKTVLAHDRAITPLRAELVAIATETDILADALCECPDPFHAGAVLATHDAGIVPDDAADFLKAASQLWCGLGARQFAHPVVLEPFLAPFGHMLDADVLYPGVPFD